MMFWCNDKGNDYTCKTTVSQSVAAVVKEVKTLGTVYSSQPASQCGLATVTTRAITKLTNKYVSWELI